MLLPYPPSELRLLLILLDRPILSPLGIAPAWQASAISKKLFYRVYPKNTILLEESIINFV
jgi:hypothetical protein